MTPFYYELQKSKAINVYDRRENRGEGGDNRPVAVVYDVALAEAVTKLLNYTPSYITGQPAVYKTSRHDE